MLLDLTKEYLSDMSITVMGDVIAILKHAKLVHSQTAREKALKGAAISQSPAEVSRRSTPASRMVGHYLGKDQETRPLNEPLPCNRSNLSKELASRLGQNPTAPPPSVVRLSKKQKEEVPVPRSRRVLPEEEGKYQVIMPSGTTARSKKLLQKHKQKQSPGGAKKSSVFDRLGQGGGGDSPSSSSSSSPSVTITGLGNVVMKRSGTASSEGSSVFRRLGGKTVKRAAATSTVGESDDEQSIESDYDDEQLGYQGVLKATPKPKSSLPSPGKNRKVERSPSETGAVVPVKKSKRLDVLTNQPELRIDILQVTSQSAETPVTTAGILSRCAPMEKKSIQARLGKKSVVTAPATTTTATVKPKPGASTVKTGVLSRLGQQKPEVSSTDDVTPSRKTTASRKGIIRRLGPKKTVRLN